jgi:hypothetical protein
MARKLVFREDLQYIIDELFFIKLEAPLSLQDKIDILIRFIDCAVLESNKENINELKREFYKSMKEAKTVEENKRYYKMLKSLDTLLTDINKNEVDNCE